MATIATNPDGSRLKASPPTVGAPSADERVTSLTPQLRIGNSEATYGAVALSYEFQVLDGATVIVGSSPIGAADSGETAWRVPGNTLKPNKTYSWQARPIFAGVAGPWSDSATFRTPLPPPVEGPVSCPGSSGPEIIACVGAAFPERLVSTAAGDFSDERRAANMEFIRDRIIETGKCKGLDLGQNYKRGTPVISHDFIVLRGAGHDRGVDIASGYDNTRNKLRLTWQVFDKDRNYGHPFYRNYGPVDCSGVN